MAPPRPSALPETGETGETQAASAIAKLGPAGDAGTVQSHNAPAIISRAIAHGRPAQPTARTRTGARGIPSRRALRRHCQRRRYRHLDRDSLRHPERHPQRPTDMALQSENLQGSPGASTKEDTMNVDWVEQFSARP